MLDPTRATTRASDADRDQAVGLLREHYAAGRLSLDEFSDRTEEALRARNLAELDLVMRELPALGARPPAPKRPARAAPSARGRALGRAFVVLWLLLSVMWIFIWATSGRGYFWPVWPIFGMGVPVLVGAALASGRR